MSVLLCFMPEISQGMYSAVSWFLKQYQGKGMHILDYTREARSCQPFTDLSKEKRAENTAKTPTGKAICMKLKSLQAG